MKKIFALALAAVMTAGMATTDKGSERQMESSLLVL